MRSGIGDSDPDPRILNRCFRDGVCSVASELAGDFIKAANCRSCKLFASEHNPITISLAMSHCLEHKLPYGHITKLACPARKVCPHLERGMCREATALAGRPVLVFDSDCTRCKLADFPMRLNNVTAALAISTRKQHRLTVPDHLVQISNGTEKLAGFLLQRYVSKWMRRLNVTAQANCGCDDLIAKMNEWGIRGSLERLDEIAQQLLSSLRKTYLGPLAIPGLTEAFLKGRVKACLLKELS